MCESPSAMGISSNGVDKDKTETVAENSGGGAASDLPKLRRTFTLPRNPFGTARSSKRKFQNKENEDSRSASAPIHQEEKSKKVFRRPSIRKFINKIAQHINGDGGGGGGGGGVGNNRVPPVSLLQTWGPEDTPGVTGLVNHGNTCFINAVLQCIAHTDVLAEYFVLDRYKIDLSRRNKLNSKKFGSKGELTEQLAVLLKALWACKYHPELTIAFKQVVEKHGAQYKGRQQHDALEFLQWLLDKVHEDLNTATKRKFKSVKTSGRPDEVIAAETLENYKRCNNSFIQGVFQAQYKSSLSCSRCDGQSNTFDPFQCISVQLPQVTKQSVYVTVLYTSQQPRQVKIGVSVQTGGTIAELRDILHSDTSIDRASMILTEIDEFGFHRTFSDAQSVVAVTERDPIYCIQAPELKDIAEDTTSAYVLLCWINCEEVEDQWKRFGSPYCMQVSRETSYDDLQKLILKEMSPILHDDVLTSSQSKSIFKLRINDPISDPNEPVAHLDPNLQHPLFAEAIDQALALCGDDAGPAHIKLILEWEAEAKANLIADDGDLIEEHFSVKHLKANDTQGAHLTLEECLKEYTGAETLTDAWRCPNCQQYQPVIKTLGVWSLPDILIVHFKRFRQQNLRGTSTTKLTTMVDFPVSGLDMSPHLASKRQTTTALEEEGVASDPQLLLMNTTNWSPWKKSTLVRQQNHHHHPDSAHHDNIYDLYAVCYHHGTSLGTGHYTAACKNPYDAQWYLYDDSKVTNLSRQSDDVSALLVNSSAYILFYQRRGGGGCSSNSSSSSAASTSSTGSSVNDHWVSRMPRFLAPKNFKSDKTSDDVALRNSQNVLKSSESEKDSIIETTNKEAEEDTAQQKLYTTSIYIDSEGKADIRTNVEKSPVLSPLRIDGVLDDGADEPRGASREMEKVFLCKASLQSKRTEILNVNQVSSK